jgi:hypothetical protein
MELEGLLEKLKMETLSAQVDALLEQAAKCYQAPKPGQQSAVEKRPLEMMPNYSFPLLKSMQ